MACGKLTYASGLLAILLLALIQTSLSQNYHFSNGWYAGKKRSSNANPINSESSNGNRKSINGYGLFEESCNIRPDAIMHINRIVQDEVARIQKSCIPDIPSGLTEILENAASALDSDGKW